MFYQYFVESPFESIEEKFLNASERCDRGALLNQLQGGSTAAIVVLDKQTGDIHAYNVGDSEILLVLQRSACQSCSRTSTVITSI